MSYDTLAAQNRRSAKQWGQSQDQQQILEDVERGSFLRALDRAEFEVTDFEARFIENFLSMNQLNWWTPGRRTTCDKMRRAYQHRLKQISPSAPSASSQQAARILKSPATTQPTGIQSEVGSQKSEGRTKGKQS